LDVGDDDRDWFGREWSLMAFCKCQWDLSSK
jgi:hypothetical protein